MELYNIGNPPSYFYDFAKAYARLQSIGDKKSGVLYFITMSFVYVAPVNKKLEFSYNKIFQKLINSGVIKSFISIPFVRKYEVKKYLNMLFNLSVTSDREAGKEYHFFNDITHRRKTFIVTASEEFFYFIMIRRSKELSDYPVFFDTYIRDDNCGRRFYEKKKP